MFLPQRFNKFFPPQFNGTGATLLGTTQKWPIPRTWPIEDLFIRVNFTTNASLALATNPTTPDQYDNILQFLQHISLQTNDGKQPRNVVDASGVALLEYADHDATNIDIGTRACMLLSQQLASLPAGNYSLVYRIAMVDDSIAEPLRSRLYLPIHTYPQDPILTISFQNFATMFSSGTSANLTFIGVDLLVVGRQVTPQSEAALQKTKATNPNGYIDWDLIETPFAIPVGTSAPQRLAIPLPGSYTNLLMRHYLGGATMTRKEIDNGATGSSFGNENRWDLETAANAIREWNWQQMRIYTEMSSAICPWMPAIPAGATSLFAASASAGSPTTAFGTLALNLLGVAGGSIPAGQAMRYANSCWFDFLTDGKSQDCARELGSVLDCNTPANTGLKMEIVGTPTNVATNASQLNVIGRRLFGDLSGWQTFA